MASQAEERHDLLDAEVRTAYQNTPWIQLNGDTFAKIRAAGATVSAAVPLPDSVLSQEINSAGVQGRLYYPATVTAKNVAADELPLVIWFHGGGYVFGFPEMHAGLYITLVTELNVAVFAVRYRLAPEHPFPAAHDDALRAWNWVLDGGLSQLGLPGSTSVVGLGGTSAGGGLAASIALRIRDAGGAVQPRALALNIPWLSKVPSSETKESSWKEVKFDRIWSLSNATFAANAYFPVGTSDPQRYAYALQHPDLSRLPPCILTIAEQDILRDSGIDFASRLFRESDAGCDLHVYRGTYHGSSGSAPTAKVSVAQNSAIVSFFSRTLLS